MTEKLYVQYGCGWSAPEQWTNFDASPTLRFEKIPIIGNLYTKNHARFPSSVRYGDIVKGLPISSYSCDGVYCSHVLEHLALNDLRVALKNTRKLLKPNGIFRFVLPDLYFLAQSYIEDSERDASLKFMTNSHLGIVERPKKLSSKISFLFGNSNHLWMWDFKSLEYELSQCGFSHIRRSEINDSIDKQFNLVESKERWENCLGVECQAI